MRIQLPNPKAASQHHQQHLSGEVKTHAESKGESRDKFDLSLERIDRQGAAATDVTPTAETPDRQRKAKRAADMNDTSELRLPYASLLGLSAVQTSRHAPVRELIVTHDVSQSDGREKKLNLKAKNTDVTRGEVPRGLGNAATFADTNALDLVSVSGRLSAGQVGPLQPPGDVTLGTAEARAISNDGPGAEQQFFQSPKSLYQEATVSRLAATEGPIAGAAHHDAALSRAVAPSEQSEPASSPVFRQLAPHVRDLVDASAPVDKAVHTAALDAGVKTGRNTGSLTVSLYPAELGKVTIRLLQRGSIVDVQLSTTTERGLLHLAKDSTAIAELVTSATKTTAQVSIQGTHDAGQGQYRSGYGQTGLDGQNPSGSGNPGGGREPRKDDDSRERQHDSHENWQAWSKDLSKI